MHAGSRISIRAASGLLVTQKPKFSSALPRLRGLLSLAKPMLDRILSTSKTGFPELVFFSVLTQFLLPTNNYAENWLLIFDNAGPPSDMDQFWPQSTNGSILVTTQDTSWLSQEYLTQSFQLDPLIHREGADLVKHIFERKNRAISDFEASSIHVETGGLPLAIRQISWYIIAENIDITEFLRNYRAHKSSKVVDAWGISTTPWYSHTLATFLDVAFEKLTSRAISILGIISLFDVDGIEGDLLRHDSQQSDGEFAILGDAPEYVSPAPLTFTSLPKYIC